MAEDALLIRVRRLWEELAGAGATFPPDGATRIVVSPNSRLCPPLWTGLVRIGDAVLITAPDERTARQVLETGLLPQWRAGNDASRRVAEKMGCRGTVLVGVPAEHAPMPHLLGDAGSEVRGFARRCRPGRRGTSVASPRWSPPSGPSVKAAKRFVRLPSPPAGEVR